MAALLARAAAHVGGAVSPAKYLIVATPTPAKVAYVRVRRGGGIQSAWRGGGSELTSLIGAGLVRPTGVAVEQISRRLIVADPGAKRISAYPLWTHEGMLFAGAPVALAQDVEAEGVATDGSGNIFFTDAANNRVLRIRASQALRAAPVSQVVYEGDASPAYVRAPAGLAADSFYAYWANHGNGSEDGSIVRGLERPAPVTPRDDPNVAALVESVSAPTGICVAVDNVYYARADASIYGVKKAGGAPVAISDKLVNPRGCAWDGAGTVYVADQGADAIYSFAGNMRALGAAQLAKAADVEGAVGVAVFSGARSRRAAATLGLGTLLAAAAAWR